MDQELAQAVLQRWQDGLEVYEGTLYKAASVLGIDPDLALAEARYYTTLDRYLASGQPQMGMWESLLFSTAAGGSPEAFLKTASKFRLRFEDLVMAKLAERGYKPDSFEKIAAIYGATDSLYQMEKTALMMGDPSQGQPDMEVAQPTGGTVGQPAGGPQPSPIPMEGAQVQQQPQVRVRPSPTAPSQLPPDPMGNFDALLQEHAQAKQLAPGAQLPGQGATPEAPPPPSPSDKIRQVAPDLPPELIERYGEQLGQVEQSQGMPIMDPKQVQQLIKQLQNADKKIINEAIKQQAETYQQQAEQQIQQMQMANVGQSPFKTPGQAAQESAAVQQAPQQPAPMAGTQKLASAAARAWARAVFSDNK